MLRKTRLFTPGPTPLLPAAQLAMAAADLHHRTPEFRAMFTRVRMGLQQFIGTENDVIVLAASGSGAMEAAVSNLVNAGDAVAVITAGKFGERWVEIGRAFGCDVRVISAEYGKTVTREQLRQSLTPELRAVFMQATESSTGVRHDVAGVAEMLAGRETLLVVDAITSVGTTKLDVDGKIDVLIGGSQKALMCPPGVAFCSVSERGWTRMSECKQPRYYFDLGRERKVQAKGESAFTPAVALIAALDAALVHVANVGGGTVAHGRELLVENAERLAAVTRASVTAAGLELFAPDAPASAMTAVKAPAGVSATDIVKRVKAEFGGILSDGQGEMKGTMFRVAHLGYFDYLDTLGVLGAIEQVLAIAGRHEPLGQGQKRAGGAPDHPQIEVDAHVLGGESLELLQDEIGVADLVDVVDRRARPPVGQAQRLLDRLGLLELREDHRRDAAVGLVPHQVQPAGVVWVVIVEHAHVDDHLVDPVPRQDRLGLLHRQRLVDDVAQVGEIARRGLQEVEIVVDEQDLLLHGIWFSPTARFGLGG